MVLHALPAGVTDYALSMAAAARAGRSAAFNPLAREGATRCSRIRT